MFCKDILVAVDASEASMTAVRSAAGLAVDHDAHLTALYLGYDPITAFAESQLPADLLQQHRDRLVRAEGDARGAFEEICRKAGIGSEWRSAWQAQTSVLMLSARYHDLVAMSGAASNDADLIAHRYADSVVIAAGRPVMLFPASYHWDRGLRHVMVAWDGSREATRAVHDAMPLLVRADKVVIMEIIESREGERRDPASDIARHLARHGVETEAAHSHKSDIALADQLLDACVDRNVDLLVAGAYGHSRLREYALGGVTRHLMTHLSIPMIFSH